ncbi:MAG: DNA repair protein RecO [Rubrivivax sp.]|nr:DNA repair protein RecO [Rubrivivax sp.]
MATSEAAAAGAPRARRGTPAAPLLAYVLHRWDWSETSLIVELFTREQGRLVVAAKGAKRPTSQLRPVLLPFQPLHAALGKAPADEAAEVFNLRGAEWVGGAPLLPAAALLAGWYLNELLMKLLARQDPHPALFDAYADALAALAQAMAGDAGAEAAALRAFELQLLRETGSLPDLGHETLTLAPLRDDARYALRAEAGLAPARRDGIAGAAWRAIEAALVHGSGDALRAACTLAPAELPALRSMLRECLHYHLGHDQLRTRRVWQGVQRLAAGAPEVPAK